MKVLVALTGLIVLGLVSCGPTLFKVFQDDDDDGGGPILLRWDEGRWDEAQWAE